MKVSKYWTTVTTFSKTIALILFIALPFIGFWVGVSYQQALDLNQGIRHSVASKKAANVSLATDMSSWRTYTDAHIGFSIQYPPDWTITQKPYTDDISKNDINVDRYVYLKGPQGYVDFVLTSTWGGACDPKYETLQTKSGPINVCHSVLPNSQESWEQITINPKRVGVDINAGTSIPAADSHEVLFKILSSLQLPVTK